MSIELQLSTYHMPENAEFNDEASRVLEIYSQIHPDLSLENPEDRDRMLDELGDGQDVFVARDEDGQIVGVTSYYLPRESTSLYLSGIAVDPEIHGEGIGQAMLNRLLKIATSNGVRAIEGQSIPSAESFYRRLGAVSMGGRFLFELPTSV